VILSTSCDALGDTRYIGYCAVFKVREEAERDTRRRGTLNPHATGIAPVSQNSTACEPPRLDAEVQSCGLPDPVDMSSGRSRSGERRGARELKATIRRRSVPSGCRGLPRKEVIQPQLPLRLPCYDFTPVASPTFDGTLLKG
jgi:hypothetical protein